MAQKIDPIRPTTAQARALARGLIDTARFAALARSVATSSSGPLNMWESYPLRWP